MSENVIQASFASGELSPSLFARVDVAKYHSGAATMRNMFVDYRSGASTRPGFEFIRPCVQNAGPVRIVRFQQSVDVTYVLEFGDKYLRFIANGGSVVQPAISITSITPGLSTFITTASGTFTNGQLIFITGSNISQLNGRYFVVDSASGSSCVLVDPFTHGNIDSTGWAPYTTGGVSQVIYQITTPYLSSELALLKFSQKASKLNITHPNHPPYALTLINATNWTLAPEPIGATIGPPASVTATGSAAGPAYYLFAVTSVDANGQESSPNFAYAAATQDMRVIDPATLTSGSVLVSWSSTGAQSYNIYASNPGIGTFPPVNSMVGYIGTTAGFSMVDANISPDFQTQPPIAQNPFTGINPQCSAYYQQRLVFANGGTNNADRFWMSQPGTDSNFNISNPSQANDALDARLVSLEVNEIKSMIPMPSGLIMLTTKGAWQVSGGAGGVATQGGPVSPTTLTATPQAYIGANDVPPILINYDIFFIQQKGSIVRDLTYNIYANIYTGNDVSVMSNHLFYGHQVREWAYAEEPFKLIWIVREDGVLLSLTILKEQEMYGWARHDTLGYFRSICTITEGPVDATYVVVERPYPIMGPFATIQQIERLHERSFEFGAEDAFSVDAGVSTAPNMPDTVLSTVIEGNIAKFQAGAAVFDNTMLGSILRVGGGKIKIDTIIDADNGSGEIIQPITNLVTDDPHGRVAIAPSGSWSVDQPRQILHGLSHLEGQRVAVLADGGVVNGLTVVDGSITLPQPASKIVVGLGFQAQLQTMYLDLGQEANTIQGKRKKVNALTVRVKDSRGLKAGRTFDTVTPIKELNRTTAMGQPTPLITADERIVMDPLWDVPGQICMQVDDPLPATVLGVIPEVVIGDTPK
jgi:hypothetical protein